MRLGAERLVEIKPIGVVGPFPADGRCVIMASGNGKIIALQCGTTDAYAISMSIRGEQTPYSRMVSILEACNISILSCKIKHDNDMLYSIVLLSHKGSKKPLKISVENPSLAASMSISGASFVHMPEKTFRKFSDCTQTYNAVLTQIGNAFPMPNLTSSNDMRIMCEFIDRVDNEAQHA